MVYLVTFNDGEIKTIEQYETEQEARSVLLERLDGYVARFFPTEPWNREKVQAALENPEKADIYIGLCKIKEEYAHTVWISKNLAQIQWEHGKYGSFVQTLWQILPAET